MLTYLQVGLLWFPTRKRGPIPRAETRRTLFELHAGREASHLPTQLALDEVNRPDTARHDKHGIISTSDDLIEALGPVGKEYATPKIYQHSMVDLSFVDPVLAALDRQAAIVKAKEEAEKQRILREGMTNFHTRKSVLVSYLLHIDPILRYEARLDHSESSDSQLDDALLEVFDDGVCKWLKRAKLDIRDFMSWAWILTADSSERAAVRLFTLAYRPYKNEEGFKTVSSFLILFLLRRQTIDARALRPILIYAWKVIEVSESFNSTMPIQDLSATSSKPLERRNFAAVGDDNNGMPEHLFIVFIIRLLRRATSAWPAACESIVAILNRSMDQDRYVDKINRRNGVSGSTTLQNEESASLNYAYNTMLRMLSLPSSLHPFHSMIYQQRAQFKILRRMDQFEPPLIVDRRGYKAVVRMQLMHKKTMKEREWEHMKAKSWPPWKEDKLGMDATIGVEQGISRAKEVLNRAKEAGYAGDDWDAVAGILSGWDTDGSPTMQTRSIKKPKKVGQGAIWAARIQATRTVDEAWSCFLASIDQTAALRDIGEPIYFAMFMKLVYDAERSSEKGKQDSVHIGIGEQPLSGDGLEVSAPPESPREATYVRRPPPRLDEFLEMMVGDGIEPSGKFLVFLLTKAWSFEAGMKCLEASTFPQQHLSALFDDSKVRTATSQAALEAIPKDIIAALVQFLARFAPTLSDKHGHDRFERVQTGIPLVGGKIGWNEGSQSPDVKPSTQVRLFNPSWTAFKLLIAWQPSYRPAWYHLIRALSRRKAVTGVYSRFAAQHIQDMKTWRLICKLLDRMLDINLHVDLEGFGLVCRGLEKAIFASEQQLQVEKRSRVEDDGKEDQQMDTDVRDPMVYAHFVLSQGLPLVKELFKNAVRSTGMQKELPTPIITEMAKTDAGIEERRKETELQDKQDEGQDSIVSENEVQGIKSQNPERSQVFLPPACLLPKLLEAPHPAQLHAFIRILGLRRDYDGIQELVEWMALFADEIGTVMDEAMNGSRQMRRCIVATRVFLERSWMVIPRDDGYDRAGKEGIVIEADPAPAEIVRAVRGLVLENKKWGGWATNEELAKYCSQGRFL